MSVQRERQVVISCVLTLLVVTLVRVMMDMNWMEMSTHVMVSDGNNYGHAVINAMLYTDVNECIANNGGCETHCNNTEGSYICSCDNGFELNSDGHSCDGMYLMLSRLNQMPLIMFLPHVQISMNVKSMSTNVVTRVSIQLVVMSVNVMSDLNWPKMDLNVLVCHMSLIA